MDSMHSTCACCLKTQQRMDNRHSTCACCLDTRQQTDSRHRTCTCCLTPNKGWIVGTLILYVTSYQRNPDSLLSKVLHCLQIFSYVWRELEEMNLNEAVKLEKNRPPGSNCSMQSYILTSTTPSKRESFIALIPVRRDLNFCLHSALPNKLTKKLGNQQTQANKLTNEEQTNYGKYLDYFVVEKETTEQNSMNFGHILTLLKQHTDGGTRCFAESQCLKGQVSWGVRRLLWSMCDIPKIQRWKITTVSFARVTQCINCFPFFHLCSCKTAGSLSVFCFQRHMLSICKRVYQTSPV